MAGPTTWTFTTAAPADTTAPVVSNVTATPSGTSLAITWTTDEASTTRIDYGTSATTLSANLTTAGSSTSHSATIANLTPNTRYYYRVTSADAAGNTAVSPAAANPAASYAPTVAPFGDTTTADFSLGSNSSTFVSGNGLGEVALQPTASTEFTTATLPTALKSTATVSGGKTTVAAATATTAGSASVSGSNLTTTAVYNNGMSLEALSTLGPNQSLGWVTSSSSSMKLTFSVNASNQVIANLNDGVVTSATSTVVSSGWTPTTAHLFRIEWTSSSATFYIDNVQKYTHAFTTWFGKAYRPQFGDTSTADAPLVLNWMRLGPYTASGTYTSRVFDAKAAVTWDGLSWDPNLPTGTSVAVKVRTGSTATPGAGWTGWTTVPTSGTTVGTTARYLQYQVTLTGSSSRFVTPSVRSFAVLAHV
jgi:hypothetical protein